MGKPTPKFWFDFNAEGNVIVQSDWPGGQCLAEFKPCCEYTTEQAVEKAVNLIADFETGRKTPNWNKKEDKHGIR